MKTLLSSPYFVMLSGGDYQAIAAQTVDRPVAPLKADDIPWIVGGLTLLGRTLEAEGLHQQHAADLSPLGTMIARFFFAVSYTRSGSVSKARRLLRSNGIDAAKSNEPLGHFLVNQGWAFYRYSTGRLLKAKLWAEAAVQAASAADFLYGSTLALELLGHIQLSSGEFFAGFRSFELARAKAQNLGQGALLQAIEISAVLYRATYGIAARSDELLEHLAYYMHHEAYQDSYTQAALHLEKTRILLLRGELTAAKDLLRATSEYIYHLSNPELEMDYNLIFAQILRAQGEALPALSLVRGAKHRVNQTEDLRSQLRVTGLEWALLTKLGHITEAEAARLRVEELTRKTGTSIAHRSLQRRGAKTSFAVRPGEDQLGDLIDACKSFQAHALGEVLAKGWLGLLPELVNVLPEERVLLFDLEVDSLTLFAQGDVVHHAEGCSTLMRKFLLILAQHPASKQTLAEQLWQQPYNPSRHDGLIYPLVGKVRKFLGIYGAWVEAFEDGYRLRADVQVRSALARKPEVSAADATTEAEGLNARQAAILRLMREQKSLEPGMLSKSLGVSDATITRDMALLVEKGLATREGRGRATRYNVRSTLN